MITVFTTARPFRDHFGIIQANAIGSWCRLEPRPQILLLGDEEGYAEVARRFNITHVPEVAVNEHGTPLLSAMIEVAEARAEHKLMLEIAADTLLFNDTIEAARQVAARFERFCLVAGRRHATIDDPIDFEDPDWARKIRDAATPTTSADVWAGDFFLYTKGLWRGMPPFAIGRTIADNWMYYHAVASGAALVDATDALVSIHQDHDYSHHAGGFEGVYSGAEARTNRAMVSSRKLETRENANWQLTPRGLRSRRLGRLRWQSRRFLGWLTRRVLPAH